MKLGTIVAGVPALIWATSYLYLALYYRRWNVLKVNIHESGRYTFIGTVFYFNHFLRELLPDTFFALTIYWTYQVTHSNTSGGEADGYFTLILIALIIFLGIVFVGSWGRVGWKNTLLDLFQFRELDTVVEFGSHWQMHFLSSIIIMLLIMLPAAFSEIEDYSLVAIIFIAFFVISLLFRTGLKAVRDARWILHGGREIITFFPLVVVPSYALNLRFEALNITPWSIAILFSIGVLLLYYSIVYLRSDVRGLAKGDFPVLYLYFSHNFEHVLDTVYISLLLAVLISS